MHTKSSARIRDLKSGDWYWINRSVLINFGRCLKPSGLAVYNVLASFANSESQSCFPKQAAIANLLGLSRRTVIRNIRFLEALGVVRVETNGGTRTYTLLEVGDVTKETGGCDKKDKKDVTPGSTNNNKITRIINDMVGLRKSLSDFDSKGFTPKTREELLAVDVCQTLNDRANLRLYLAYCKKLPEALIRKALGEAMEIRARKIRKSRGAYFNFLIKHYAKGILRHPGNKSGE